MTEKTTSFYSLFIGPEKWLQGLPDNPMIHEARLSVKDIEAEMLGATPDPEKLVAVREVIRLSDVVSRRSSGDSCNKCSLCSMTAVSHEMEIKTTRKGKTTMYRFFACAACAAKLKK